MLYIIKIFYAVILANFFFQRERKVSETETEFCRLEFSFHTAIELMLTMSKTYCKIDQLFILV